MVGDGSWTSWVELMLISSYRIGVFMSAAYGLCKYIKEHFEFVVWVMSLCGCGAWRRPEAVNEDDGNDGNDGDGGDGHCDGGDGQLVHLEGVGDSAFVYISPAVLKRRDYKVHLVPSCREGLVPLQVCGPCLKKSQ